MSQTILWGDIKLPTKCPCPASQMSRISLLVAFALLLSACAASAERIKRKPPTNIEASRIASDQAMSDGMLRIGDVVATDRGFFQFRGLAPDGSSDFLAVPNPLSPSKSAPSKPRATP
jgi:hypothetical protein